MPNKYLESHNTDRGFTLIEVMIVVAIIAILASIALPSYTDYTRRAKATESVAQLSTWRSQLEQFFLDNRSYRSGTACGVAAPTGKHYTYSCATTGDQVFTLTATSNKAGDGVYTVDQSNQQATTTFKGNTVSGKNCWLIRGDEC